MIIVCLPSTAAPHQIVREVVVSSRADPDSASDHFLIRFELPETARSLSADDLYAMGESFLLKNQPSEAAPYLARAAELLPSDPFAQGNFAITLHQARASPYGRSLRFTCIRPTCLTTRAGQIGRSADAVVYFKKAAALMPVAVYFSNLAQALWSLGEVREL